MKEVKEQLDPLKTVDGTYLPQGKQVSLQGRLRLDAVKNIMVHICWYFFSISSLLDCSRIWMHNELSTMMSKSDRVAIEMRHLAKP